MTTQIGIAENLAAACHSDGVARVLAQARCAEVDLDIFFPHKGGSTRDALRVCAGCEVRQDCLQLALDLGADGIWGGTTVRQRRQLTREAVSRP